MKLLPSWFNIDININMNMMINRKCYREINELQRRKITRRQPRREWHMYPRLSQSSQCLLKCEREYTRCSSAVFSHGRVERSLCEYFLLIWELYMKIESLDILWL